MTTTLLYIAGFTAACLLAYLAGEAVAAWGVGRYWSYVVVGLGFGMLERGFDLGGSLSDAAVVTGVSLGVVGLAVGLGLAWALDTSGKDARSLAGPVGLATALAVLGILTLWGLTSLSALALVTPESRAAAALLVGVALIAPALGEGRDDALGHRTAALVAFIALAYFASATGVASALFAPAPGVGSVTFAAVIAPLLAAGVGAGLALVLAILASDRLPASLLAPGLLITVLGVSVLLERATWLPGGDTGIDAALVFAVATVLAARRREPRTRLGEAVASLGPLVYIVFFTFVGSQVRTSAVMVVALLAAVYVAARAAVVVFGVRYLDTRAGLDGSSVPAVIPLGVVALALAGAVGVRFPMVGDSVVALAVLAAMLGEASGPSLARRLSPRRVRVPRRRRTG
jgi:hypothetical protein